MLNPFVPRLRNISLYLHIPFCENKCPYCAFDSFTPNEGDVDLYLELIEKEVEWWSRRLGRVTFSTCYIGGGTPTTLTGPQWLRLTQILDKYFDFKSKAEITVEANPNSLKTEHLLHWRDWRVNRISLGVQSFDDAELIQLGRIHNSAQAHNAISAALAASFSVSIDLMFGLPKQTFQNWGRTLKESVASGVQHLSLYQLSFEPGSAWENMPKETLPDGYCPYRWAQWYLPRKGYMQYEVANFSRAGRESKHNINYWREGEYLGLGLGASGYLSGWRYKNTSVFREYSELLRLKKSVIVSGERLSLDAKSKEAFILALRMSEGINRNDYKNKYGELNEQNLIKTLRTFPNDLYEITKGNIALTAKGMRVANIIWTDLI
ncbi:MAG: radical SAM family heme chaperone HemW [Synergistaceae bacterium]|jgi:oxygen-independent coproporphyrinogen-3 oxidase|nr:radical SAM family heme chaperone HemW [Synergistaceae bacterium]